MSILFAQRRRNAARKREFTARTSQSFDKAEIATYNLTEPEKIGPKPIIIPKKEIIIL